LNTVKTLSWKINSKNPFELIKVDNPDYKYIIEKKKEKYHCQCGVFKAMLMPCEHILIILIYEDNEKEVLDYFDVGWELKNVNVEADDEALKELERLINEEKKDQQALKLDENSIHKM